MHRRSFLLGLAAATIVPTTVHARAWGASGYMTRRVREAEASGRRAFRNGEHLSTNPHEVNGYEFNAWAEGYASEAAIAAMTDEERAAFEAKKAAEAEEMRRIMEEMNRDMTMIPIGIFLSLAVLGGLAAWAFVSHEQGVQEEHRPRSAEKR